MGHISNTHKPEISTKDRNYINIGCHDVILLYASDFDESWKHNCNIFSLLMYPFWKQWKRKPNGRNLLLNVSYQILHQPPFYD